MRSWGSARLLQWGRGSGQAGCSERHLLTHMLSRYTVCMGSAKSWRDCGGWAQEMRQLDALCWHVSGAEGGGNAYNKSQAAV